MPISPDALALRLRAEAHMKSLQLAAPLDCGAHEMQRVLQELQIHQIELEMQNEELRSTRAELAAGLLRYTELYDCAPIGYFSLDRQGANTKVNLAGARMLGQERSTLLGKRLAAFVAEGDLPILNALIPGIFSGQAQTTCEVTLASAESVPRVIHVEATASQDKQECLAVVTDITERKQAELALLQRDQRLASLVDSAMDAIITVDENLCILMLNTAASAMFGCQKAEAIGQPIANFLPEKFRADHAVHVHKFGAGDLTARSMGKTIGVHTTALRTDGREFPMEATISHAEVQGKQLFSVIIRDISARLAAEAAREMLEARLRVSQKLEAVGALASGIAHDFNNILGAIDGYTELARSDAANQTTVVESLAEVSKASSRAANLVQQILTFARQEEQPRQIVQLAPLVQEALKLLRVSVPASIEFQLTLAPDVPAVLASPTQIHQVIMNLGTNAAHAMRGKVGRLEVTLGSCVVDAHQRERPPELRPGSYVHLSVSDTGAGMDEATAQRVFDPFFTTKRLGEGTGLGLSVVHGIMRSCQGAITVCSKPGEGSTFDLYFPALDTDGLPSSASVPVLVRGNGERILFVDDEESLAKFAKKTLERLGYLVDVETKPLRALATVRANVETYALVVTDLTMPELLGTEIATQLLQLKPGLPIILTTGYSADLTSSTIAALGIRAVLLKPFSIAALGQAIYQALHGQAAPL